MKINVLIVDDLPNNLYALEVLLEELEIDDERFEGLNIFKALSGEEALKILLKESIDLILLDVIMPQMDGFELAELIKQNKKFSDIPIVFLTAEFKSEEFVKKGYKVGALDYFTKPIEKFEFLSKISLYVKLFLSCKIKEKEFSDTLLDYVKLMDKHVLFTYLDMNKTITDVSQAFCDLVGYSKEELIGKSHKILRSSNLKDEKYDDIWESVDKNLMWKGKFKDKKKSGEDYRLEVFASPRYDKNRKQIGYILVKHDRTDRKASITDSLTKLFNRRYFDEIAPEIIENTKKYDRILCFALMDIDFFKNYNDTYGHQAGDNALINITKVFKSSIKRRDDYCFRIGGEEFCMIFLAKSEQKAIDFMKRIQSKVEELKIEHKTSGVSDFLTISVGLSCKRKDDIESLESLFEETDKLLYQAKETGRNKMVSILKNGDIWK